MGYLGKICYNEHNITRRCRCTPGKRIIRARRSDDMSKVEELINAIKAEELLNVKDELMNMTRLNELLNKKEEKKTSKVVWVFAIIGIVVAIAAIAYGVYRYFAPDYYDDFEDVEFEDEYEEDFFEDEEIEPVSEEATEE